MSTIFFLFSQLCNKKEEKIGFFGCFVWGLWRLLIALVSGLFERKGENVWGREFEMRLTCLVQKFGFVFVLVWLLIGDCCDIE